MIAYAVPRPESVVLPIVEEDAVFPVRRVFCVGRNYAAHAREMGGDGREAPFFFSKPADGLAPGGGEIPYPSATADLHHEVELVVALAHGGSNFTPEQADAAIFGWAIGVDLTRRDLQAEAKAKGRPWDAAKGFDFSGPISAVTPRLKLDQPRGRLRLRVGGTLRQEGDLADMIWSPAEVVAQASKLWRLAPGDLIFTGTPEGVGPLVRGDKVEALCDGLSPLRFRVV